MSALAIINPRSAGGRTGKDVSAIAKKLRAALGDVDIAVTKGPMDAARLSREGLAKGHTLIVAIGGDGTLSEVINGFFENGQPVAPEAAFGFVMAGTGGDFRKTFGIAEGIDAGIAHLATAGTRALDIGRLSFTAPGGETRERYFNNIASFGLSGAVVDAVNRARFTKLFGGPFAFAVNSLTSMMRYNNKPVRIQVDDHFDETLDVSTVAVCNGQYFGGGMRMAPDAAPDDGQFDVVMMFGTSKREAMTGLGDIYTGAHLKNPKVKVARGRKVVATPVTAKRGPVLVDADGEQPGRLPATFEIMPRALKVRC